MGGGLQRCFLIFDIGGPSTEEKIPLKKKNSKTPKNSCVRILSEEANFVLFEMVSLGCRWCFGVQGDFCLPRFSVISCFLGLLLELNF
jgi:hypothetical protein